MIALIGGRLPQLASSTVANHTQRVPQANPKMAAYRSTFIEDDGRVPRRCNLGAYSPTVAATATVAL